MKFLFNQRIVSVIFLVGLHNLFGATMASASGSVTIPTGTPVLISLNQELQSGSQKVGDTVTFVVDTNICAADGTILIPQGALATGKVTQSTAHGMLGSNGKIKISCDYVTAPDGTQITFADPDFKDVGGGMILAPPLVLLFSKGHDVFLRAGTPFIRSTASDTAIHLATPGTTVPSTVQLTPKGRNTVPYTATIKTITTNSITVTTTGGDKTIKLSDITKLVPTT